MTGDGHRRDGDGRDGARVRRGTLERFVELRVSEMCQWGDGATLHPAMQVLRESIGRFLMNFFRSCTFSLTPGHHVWFCKKLGIMQKMQIITLSLICHASHCEFIEYNSLVYAGLYSSQILLVLT